MPSKFEKEMKKLEFTIKFHGEGGECRGKF